MKTPREWATQLDDEDCTCPNENRARYGCVKCTIDVIAAAMKDAAAAERERLVKVFEAFDGDRGRWGADVVRTCVLAPADQEQG